jgi:DNA-binding transcriptional ArsR family regulator
MTVFARFDTEALTRVRFAISPMLEMVRSVSALDDPARLALHLPWVESARPLVEDLDLAPLRALQMHGVYNPDFVHPPPAGPLAEFEEELAVMLTIPARQIRAEVRSAREEARVPPPELARFEAHPRRAIRELAELMRAYWARTLAGSWPRIRSLLEHDVLYRARQIADGGTRRLFADLDPGVRWDDGVLQVECGSSEHRVEIELDDRGLLLLPSVFVWPKVSFVTAAPWQPTLIYPARGVGTLWSREREPPPDALAKLLGHSRAALLVALGSPRSTTELAGALGLSPGAVSQHLAVLREAGLVCGHRVARNVLYLRSGEGDALLAASTPDEAHPEPVAG